MANPTELGDFRSDVAKAKTTPERLRRLALFLAAAEAALRSEERQIRYDALQETAFLLSKRVCDGPIWDWFQEMAFGADFERQENMRIAILELVPETPIIWSDLFRLWDMWFDPEARWAVVVAYHFYPRRVERRWRRYSAHRRRNKLPVPDFSVPDFNRIWQEHFAGVKAVWT